MGFVTSITNLFKVKPPPPAHSSTAAKMWWWCRTAVPSILGLFAAGYVGGLVSRNTFHAPSNAMPPLYDVVHEWSKRVGLDLDFTDPDSVWSRAPDNMMSFIGLPTIFMCVSSGIVTGALLTRVILNTKIFLVMLRCLTIGVTVLPSPISACRHKETIEEVDAILPEALIFTAPLGCNDCIPSGHAQMFLLCASVWQFSHWHWACKVFVWAVVAFALTLSVLTHDHYTVDVILAIQVAALVIMLRKKAFQDAFNGKHGDFIKNKEKDA
jgi:hypothetical protein